MDIQKLVKCRSCEFDAPECEDEVVGYNGLWLIYSIRFFEEKNDVTV